MSHATFVTDFEYGTSDYFILAFRLSLIGGICHNCCIVAVHDVSCRFDMLNNGCIHHKNYRCSVIIAAVGGYCFSPVQDWPVSYQEEYLYTSVVGPSDSIDIVCLCGCIECSRNKCINKDLQ